MALCYWMVYSVLSKILTTHSSFLYMQLLLEVLSLPWVRRLCYQLGDETHRVTGIRTGFCHQLFNYKTIPSIKMSITLVAIICTILTLYMSNLLSFPLFFTPSTVHEQNYGIQTALSGHKLPYSLWQKWSLMHKLWGRIYILKKSPAPLP